MKKFYYHEKITEHNINVLRKDVFYLRQHFYLGNITLNDSLEILKFNNNIKTSSKDKLFELMEKLELKQNYLKKSVKQLSGGEKQR